MEVLQSCTLALFPSKGPTTLENSHSVGSQRILCARPEATRAQIRPAEAYDGEYTRSQTRTVGAARTMTSMKPNNTMQLKRHFLIGTAFAEVQFGDMRSYSSALDHALWSTLPSELRNHSPAFT